MEAWFKQHAKVYNRELQYGNIAMPASGTARYEGIAEHFHRPDPKGTSVGQEIMMSQVVMTADFGSGRAEGAMGGFRRQDGGPVDGLIAIGNGVITENSLSADLSGSMTVDGDQRAIDGTLDARFAGDGADGLRGTHHSTSDDGILWGHVTAQRTDR